MSKVIAVFRTKAHQDLPEYSSGVSGTVHYIATTSRPVTRYSEALDVLGQRESELTQFMIARKVRIPHHSAFSHVENDNDWSWIVNWSNPHVYSDSGKHVPYTSICKGLVVADQCVQFLGNPIEIRHHNPRALVAVAYENGQCGLIAWERLPDADMIRAVHWGEPSIDLIVRDSASPVELQHKREDVLVLVGTVGRFAVEVVVPVELAQAQFDPPHWRKQ
jgi:hypothetical protein